MADLDEFLNVAQDLREANRPRRAHPKGWEPGIDTAKGTLTVQGTEQPQDWSVVLANLGLDPAAWRVDESQPVQIRSWDTAGGDRLYYYKATVEPLRAAVSVDVDALVSEVKKAKKTRQKRSQKVERALVVCLADWQAGKADFGGPEALVQRLWWLRDAVVERIGELQTLGKPVDALYVVGMGDLIENCGNDHYAMQDFQVALDRRQQVKLVRRMLVEMLTLWAPLFPRVVVSCVPGNHGENRRAGKAYTTFEDNDDLAVFEQVQEIFAANPEAFGHVAWVIPDGDMSVTLDVAGTVVGFAHGHQFRGSGKPQQKAENWWRAKAASRHRIGDADVLVSAHYHHLTLVEDGPRTWMQCPAMDGGSRWFEEQGGPRTRVGTLTFLCSADGWDEMKVLR